MESGPRRCRSGQLQAPAVPLDGARNSQRPDRECRKAGDKPIWPQLAPTAADSAAGRSYRARPGSRLPHRLQGSHRQPAGNRAGDRRILPDAQRFAASVGSQANAGTDSPPPGQSCCDRQRHCFIRNGRISCRFDPRPRTDAALRYCQ